MTSLPSSEPIVIAIRAIGRVPVLRTFPRPVFGCIDAEFLKVNIIFTKYIYFLRRIFCDLPQNYRYIILDFANFEDFCTVFFSKFSAISSNFMG